MRSQESRLLQASRSLVRWTRKPLVREALTFYFCISPWLFGFLIFILGAMLYSAGISLTRWDMLSPPKFVGVENYVEALTDDELFWKSLLVTAYYSFASVPLNLVLGLAIALLMNQATRVIGLYRTLYYLPSVLSGVAAAFLWKWVLNPKYGLINGALGLLGIKGPMWLVSPEWAMPAMIIMSMWSAGGGMLIYLAGLQGIPTVLYEAAEIDGASSWQRFLNVTIPMISPVILYNLIMGIIWSFQAFTAAYIMTEGGPLNATLFYVLYLYRNAFNYFNMGYASALAWILFGIITVLTLLVIRWSDMWVFYEGLRDEKAR